MKCKQNEGRRNHGDTKRVSVAPLFNVPLKHGSELFVGGFYIRVKWLAMDPSIFKEKSESNSGDDFVCWWRIYTP
uniref:Uncharacterized protein n=1 Tax=Salix viminalis TaxID=40686 RepID=A0A6N2KYP1_SALVM